MVVSTSGNNGREQKFRSEIHGLRGVSALLVAVCHIWFAKVSGGVDVFFVISGFLVLGPLVERCLSTGRADIGRVATSLMKRIVPTALVVLAACLLLAITIIPATRWPQLAKEILASALFHENWRLASDSVDYLARDELPSLVQNYWAISAQAQFYLVMGTAVAMAAALARWRRWPIAPLLIYGLILIFTLSFAWSVYLTAENQSVAYFSTSTRLWEFCLGGLLFLALPWIRLPDRARLAAGWIGLLAIVSCSAVIPVASSFPGYTALWPTLAACLVIAAGTSGSAFGADRVLSTKPLQAMGSLSYGFYLWHWPLLIVYRVLFDTVDIDFIGGLGIILVAIVLAAGTVRLVEEPVRHLPLRGRQPWPALAFAVAFILPVVGGVLGWKAYISHERKREWVTPLDQDLYPGAKAFDMQPSAIPETPLRPNRVAARKDRPAVYIEDCHQSLRGTEILRCTYGDDQADTTIAVVGGSHSAHWLPALRVMTLDRPVRIVTYTKSACLLSMKHYGWARHKKSCIEWRDKVIAELLETRPDIVFTTANKSSIEDKSVPEAYIAAWRLLEKAGIEVAAIRDTPMMEVDIPECVELHGLDAPRCSRPTMLDEPDPFRSPGAMPSNVHFIDLSSYFCDQSLCPPTAGNILIYTDSHHLTATYSRSLAPMLQPHIQWILDDADQGLLIGLNDVTRAAYASR